jgi:hypothetical protein
MNLTIDIMGQRTLAFTNQMLRIFSLVELEELDSWDQWFTKS